MKKHRLLTLCLLSTTMFGGAACASERAPVTMPSLEGFLPITLSKDVCPFSKAIMNTGTVVYAAHNGTIRRIFSHHPVWADAIVVEGTDEEQRAIITVYWNVQARKDLVPGDRIVHGQYIAKNTAEASFQFDSGPDKMDFGRESSAAIGKPAQIRFK